MELSFIVIFWYGILHAFGPDHLTAIADFSIGKSKKKTFLITVAFAIGHGVMLFFFAKILQNIQLPEYVTQYGDLISSTVIVFMGLYFLYMALSNKIFLHKHTHNNKEHIHISFFKTHNHNEKDTTNALTIGALMGLGGVRGMLITLGFVQGNDIDLTMVLFFALGVMVIFIGFGVVINYINEKFLNTQQNVNRVFVTAGLLSIVVGAQIYY